MVDISKVEGMMRNLHRFTGHLEETATLGSDDFLADPMKTGAAKYYLQVSIEACIGIANHIIASEGYRAPGNYKEHLLFWERMVSYRRDLWTLCRRWRDSAICRFTSTGRQMIGESTNS